VAAVTCSSCRHNAASHRLERGGQNPFSVLEGTETTTWPTI
jgi:hypothetical protein